MAIWESLPERNHLRSFFWKKASSLSISRNKGRGKTSFAVRNSQSVEEHKCIKVVSDRTPGMFRLYDSSDKEEGDTEGKAGCSEEIIVISERQNLLQRALERSQKLMRHTVIHNQLARAIENNDVMAVEGLIALGVFVDGCDPGQIAPLLRACVLGHTEIMELLLANGSDPNAEVNSMSPLIIACCNPRVLQRTEGIRLLLSYGADVNVRDGKTVTALMHAASHGYENVVTLLLSAPGIDINLKDGVGSNALYYAIRYFHPEIARILIQAGIDLNAKDIYGKKALSLASYAGGNIALAMVRGMRKWDIVRDKYEETESESSDQQESADEDEVEQDVMPAFKKLNL